MKLDPTCPCGKREAWTSWHEARLAAVDREYRWRKQGRWRGAARLNAYQCEIDPAVFHIGNTRDQAPRLRRVK